MTNDQSIPVTNGRGWQQIEEPVRHINDMLMELVVRTADGPQQLRCSCGLLSSPEMSLLFRDFTAAKAPLCKTRSREPRCQPTTFGNQGNRLRVIAMAAPADACPQSSAVTRDDSPQRCLAYAAAVRAR